MHAQILDRTSCGIVDKGILKFPLIIVINTNRIRAPITYLEKTKKKRDEPSSNAIFAELGTNANKTDENKTKKIPPFIETLCHFLT
tara:strand:+ start:294 stop:551 length:258 start_codon:yes stop_codon:yes gene_type:complete